MNPANAIARALTRSPLIAVTLYVAVLGGLLATAGFAIADIVGHRRRWRKPPTCWTSCAAASRAAPTRLRSRPSIRARRSWRDRPSRSPAPRCCSGSPAAVGNVGGTIQSSQVDVLGTQARDGLVGLVVSCEMEQPALQKAALRS